MTAWVATRAILYRYFPAAAAVPDALQLASIALPGTFELPGHGFAGGERIRFFARAGSTLSPQINGQTWYPVATTTDPDFFTCTGLTLTSAGVGTPWIREDFGPKIDAIMADVSSVIIAAAIAYKGPWSVAPGWASPLAADLAAPRVAATLRISEARYDVEDMRRRTLAAEKILDILRSGAPMPDGVGPIDATSTPDNAARAGSVVTPATEWRTGYL